MLWTILLVFLIVFGIISVWKYGVFDKFQLRRGRLLRFQILYLPYRGEYKKVGPIFEEITRNTKQVFSLSDNFGYYYDNPNTTAPENCRAIIGIKVNSGQQYKINRFLQLHPEYRRAQIETTRILSYEMPYINILSIILMIKKVYPQIHEYIKKHQKENSQDRGMIELYKFLRSDKKIEIILPLDNSQQFKALIQNDQIKNKSVQKKSVENVQQVRIRVTEIYQRRPEMRRQQ